MNRKELETAAIDAHRAGDDWATFWHRYGPHAIALEPHDRGWPPEADSEPPTVPVIDDVTTRARLLWSPASEATG